MRLSGFILSLLFISATVLAEHSSSSGGGFSGGSGASWGSAGASAASAFSVSSTSSGSHASSGSSAGSSHSSSASTSSHSSSAHSSSQSSNTHSTAKPEMTSGRSLFHPFRKAKPIERAEFKRPVPCVKAPCAVCPPGQSHNGAGRCALVASACLGGQLWNGFGCVAQNGWYNDCSQIARQLADQAQRMREDNDPGQALIYERLRRQYEACLARGGYGRFGGLGTLGLLDDAELFDLP